MKDFMNKNSKICVAALAGGYFLFGLIQMIINDYFNVWWLLTLICLSAFVVYVFVLEDIKNMSLVPAGAIATLAILDLISTIRSFVSLGNTPDNYIVVAVICCLIYLAITGLWVLNVLSSLKAWQNKWGPIDSKLVPIAQLALTVLASLLYYINNLVLYIKWDVSSGWGRLIISFLFGLLMTACKFGTIYVFVSTASLKEIAFSASEKEGSKEETKEEAKTEEE